MRAAIKRLTAMILAMGLILAFAAQAETVRGDLTERFSDVVSIEYENATYRMRNRLTAVLGALIDDGTDAQAQTRMHYLLVVDDDEKTINKIYIDGDTLITLGTDAVPGHAAGDQMRLDALYGAAETPEAGCALVYAAVCALFPEAQIDEYCFMRLAGLESVCQTKFDMTQDDAGVADQLKVLLKQLEGSSGSDYKSTYSALSPYILTEMKSGAAMKVYDKFSRYEVMPTLTLAGERIDDAAFIADADEIRRLTVQLFYKAAA